MKAIVMEIITLTHKLDMENQNKTIRTSYTYADDKNVLVDTPQNHYITTSSHYGMITPNIHTMPINYQPKKGGFTKVLW